MMDQVRPGHRDTRSTGSVDQIHLGHPDPPKIISRCATTVHTPFELNCGYHPRVFFEEDVDPCSRARSANELVEELRELIEVCCQNFLHAQELQKRAHDKGVKSCSYAPGEKVWLNSKYIKTKRNKKLESMFFGPF